MLPNPPSATTTNAVSANGAPAVGYTGYDSISSAPAAPTHAAPIPNARPFTRCTSMPISVAATRSSATARIARPVSVYSTNANNAAVSTSAPIPSITVACDTAIAPRCSVPRNGGFGADWKSLVSVACATPCISTSSPNVPNTVASGGPASSRRTNTRYTTIPNRNIAIATSGKPTSGPSPSSARPSVAYIASMRNSPCAKFTTSITPYTSVSPTATSANTSPVSNPPARSCPNVLSASTPASARSPA